MSNSLEMKFARLYGENIICRYIYLYFKFELVKKYIPIGTFNLKGAP